MTESALEPSATILSEGQKELIIGSVRNLGVLAMYPLATLTYMLLAWQGGDLEGTTLIDSDCDEEEEDDDGEPMVKYTTEEEYQSRMMKLERHYTALGVDVLFRHHPKLEEYLKGEFDETLVSKISTAAANQRSVHTTYIYQDILQYLRPSKEEGLAGFDIPANLSREERGLENHVTARFLIPRQHLDAFEKDPNSIINRFRGDDPDWSLVAEDWPTFLYDEQAGWNEKDIRKGLFRGHVLARVALRLFRNKTAVNDDTIGTPYNAKAKGKGRRSLVTKHNITEVTPPMVAYASLQTYVGLSSMKQWGVADGSFSLIHFYHLIVKTLSNSTDQWVTETMDWWQRKIFGDSDKDTAGTLKKLRITTQSAYKLMKKQALQAGGSTGAPEQVDTPLTYTFPRWTQHSAPPRTPGSYNQHNDSMDGQDDCGEERQGHNNEGPQVTGNEDLQGDGDNSCQSGADRGDQNNSNEGARTNNHGPGQQGEGEQEDQNSSGVGGITQQQGSSDSPPAIGAGEGMEDEASPSTPLHLPGTGQAQSASTPEQPRRHHPRDDDTGNHPNEDNTQDSHGPHKRCRPEQDEEPSDVPAPKPKRGRGGKGARGGRGAKAKANGPNARPAIDQEVRRSGRTSAIGSS